MGGSSFSSDQTTLNQTGVTTGANLRSGRTRVTSIQGRGEAGSVLLLHDAAATGDADSDNLKAFLIKEISDKNANEGLRIME